MIRLSIACLLLAPLAAAQVRVGDVTTIDGVQANRVEGLGLVTGLNGTGDDTITTRQMLSSFYRRQGINVPANQIKAKNAAVVLVSASIPPFVRLGSSIDVSVQSIEEAKSLKGGYLVETVLTEGNVPYVVAGGDLIVGGFSAGGAAANVQQNHPTVAKVPGGGEVVQVIEMQSLGQDGSLRLVLNHGDAENARRIATAINETLGQIAKAEDDKTVAVFVPADRRLRTTDFIADVLAVEFEPTDGGAVVVNERNGVIVAGANVRISQCVIQQGDLTIAVSESPIVSQPAPFSQGQTETVPRTQLTVEEETSAPIDLTGETTVGQLIRALDAVGASPRDQIAVLQQLQAGGFLHAHLIVQ
ncbi:MAG: flagellar basal body P-ring protein FlgI [Planctomycetota bacterium]